MSARRNLLAGGAAMLGAAVALPATAIAPTADVELLALCRQALAMGAERGRLHAAVLAAEERHDDAAADLGFDQELALCPVLEAVEARIVALPAFTDVGRSAKARVLLARLTYPASGLPSEADALAHSLARDVLALGGEAA